jgi:hypothetical protein
MDEKFDAAMCAYLASSPDNTPEKGLKILLYAIDRRKEDDSTSEP